jgi:hypothetical protein
MDPKIDSLNSVVYIIIFLIPGFIFYKVTARYIVHEKYDGSEKLISILAASSFLHALGLLVLMACLDVAVRWQSVPWLVIELLVWPPLAGFVFGRFAGGTWGEWLRRRLGANPREPTAWAYFWGQRKPVMVRAFLDDGTAVVGAFSQNSSASIPNTDDLYLEKQYVLDNDKRPTALAAQTMGCWIPAARLRLVEFYDLQPKENTDGQVKAGDRDSPGENGSQRRSPSEEGDNGDPRKAAADSSGK